MGNTCKDGMASGEGRRSSQRGQAIIMVSVGIMFLMGIIGLVVDVGWGYYRKQVTQAAVDSAATAAVVAAGSSPTCGSGGVVCQSSTSCSSATSGSNLYSGCQYGLKNGVSLANLSISGGTTTPVAGVAVKYWVTATASEPLTPTFLQALGIRTGTVASTATGGVITSGTGSGGGCLYVLDPSLGQAMYLNGASLTVTCGVYVNSSNTTNAFQLNSAAGLLTAPSLRMVTGAKIDCSGCGCKTDTYYGTQNPSNTTQCTDPTYGAATSDPLSTVPAPSYSGCDHTNYSWSNLTPAQTLSPGVYCGGINIGGGTITFNPGTYVLNGGGLKIQGGSNTNVSGTGVYFYNTSNGYTAGSLLISSQTNATFTSPSSGPYQGIWFMQDHNVCPSTGHAVNGNATAVKVNGSIYLHCTQTGGSYSAQNILYTGQSYTGYYTALVVDTFQTNGQANLVLDPSGGSNTGIGLSSGSKPFLIQ